MATAALRLAMAEVSEGKRMQTNWAPEHSDALREYAAKEMSFSEIAAAINAKFNTDYSRSATIGRARRMGLAGTDRPNDAPKPPANPSGPTLHRSVGRHVPEAPRRVPVSERAAALKLRCIGIAPRHLSLLDLAPDDCRYPYGGDEEGEAITFCGHARHPGSSYCVSHFHLTQGRGTASERAAVPFALRLVEAA
jgi:GcrA cell cycle regulator